MRSIVLYLLSWLEKSLDPDLQARLKVLNQHIADAEDREKQVAILQQKADAAYLAATEYRKQIEQQIVDNKASLEADEKSLVAIQEQRKKIADDLQKAKADIANQSDHDAVRADV